MATIQMYYLSDVGYQLYYPQTDMASVINLNTTINGINSTISSNYNTLNNKFNNYYTKTETLSSTTATSYGQAASANPDAVFQTLNTQSYPQIGDVKITARTDLDDSWILCNGSLVLGDVYPELWNMLKMNESDNWVQYKEYRFTGDYAKNVLYYNNNYIVCRVSSSFVFYVFEKDLSSYNQINYNPSYINNRDIYETELYIEDNKILIINRVSNNFNISQSSNINGPWTETHITNNIGTLRGLINGSNYYVIIDGGNYRNSISILYSRTITNTSWSSSLIANATYSGTYVPYGGVFFNNYYIIGYRDTYNNQSGFYYTTNPSGSWTNKIILNNDSGLSNIAIINNTLIFYGDYGYSYTTSSPTGSLTSVSTTSPINWFGYLNNSYYFIMNGYFYKTNNLRSFSYAQKLGSVDVGVYTDIFYNSQNFIEFAYNNTSSVGIYFLGGALPTISLDKVYAYIKAK